MPTLHLPTLLRQHAGDQASVPVAGADIGTCLLALCTAYPGLKSYVFSESGQLQCFINVYLNGKDIRYLDGVQTAVKPDDSIELLLSIAGG